MGRVISVNSFGAGHERPRRTRFERGFVYCRVHGSLVYTSPLLFTFLH